MKSSRPAAALAAAALLALTASASAHVTFENGKAAPNATYKAVLRIPHGCNGQPTLKVRVRIPEGVVAVKPMPKAGWTLETIQGSYAKAYLLFGKPVTAGVTEIVWAGSLPDSHYDEFTFQAQITDAYQPGATVAFPVIQECATAREEWVEIPAAGQNPHDLRMPAPTLTIAGAAGALATVKAGSLVIAQPWSRVTPGGAKVGGGYVRITNTGPEPDRLIGGSFPLAARVEVHEMSMADNIMRMKPVEGGLEIGPSATVELKPGGIHLMFLDLKDSLREGQTIKGTLVFQKAGPVEVEYVVRGMRDPGAAAEHQH